MRNITQRPIYVCHYSLYFLALLMLSGCRVAQTPAEAKSSDSGATATLIQQGREVELFLRSGKLKGTKPNQWIEIDHRGQTIIVVVSQDHSFDPNNLPSSEDVWFFTVPREYLDRNFNPYDPQNETAPSLVAVNITSPRKELKPTNINVARKKRTPCGTITTIQPQTIGGGKHYYMINDYGQLGLIKTQLTLPPWRKVVGATSGIDRVNSPIGRASTEAQLLRVTLQDDEDDNWKWE